MEKLKLGVIFGGKSTENEVSVVSASSVLSNLDREKYEIYPVFIDKEGKWWETEIPQKTISFGETINKKYEIENIIEYLKKLDMVFPVLHGLYGEDGTIQGLLELLNIKYVGCHVLSSSVSMDKVYTKVILEKAKIKQAKSEYIRRTKDGYIYIDKEFNESRLDLKEIVGKISKRLEFPMFVKPSNSGSSVGISKVDSLEELEEAIEFASEYDNKILVEQGIIGREIECAVLGNEDVFASCVGEVKAADEFYSYDAKYNNKESLTEIPANLPDGVEKRIQSIAVKVFKALDGKGLARVDFFYDEKNDEIYLNEINTMPGFTNISMYPKLMKESKIDYYELLDRVINLAK